MPLKQTMKLKGGTEVTHLEAVNALDTAMEIIEKIGTVESESSECYRTAQSWMVKYYPAWAE